MDTGFDMTKIQRGARLRRTPYLEATQRYDPKGFTVYNHMLFPINYDDFDADYDKLLNDVMLWNVSVERNVEITGTDGLEFADLLTPRDLSKCEIGQCKYVMITVEDGLNHQRSGPFAPRRESLLAGFGR